ncbi:dipeptidase [Neolewinella persica]|uniref:dipeptidase n=1 Tax=Neolewinella persica TaxID=70998 RepID=UPI0003700492|nr:membrane dipeptidase [Neolewinella persica]
MNTQPLIIDGHLDLSMNAMEWNRDLRRPVADIRALEQGMTDKPDRGNSTVAFPEMRAGNVGICIGTLIARYAKPTHPLGGWRSPEQAWGMVQAQLAWYDEMIRQGELTMIRNGVELEDHLSAWNMGETKTIGFLLSLEGADSIVTFDHLERLYERGLRAIGPAHYGPGTYAFGTNSEGSIGDKGRELLKKMDGLGMALDTTHLCDTSFWEAMDCFQGVVWASHSNCRSLVDHNRQFSDDQLKALVERDAVIGMPLDAWMMVPNWVKGEYPPVNPQVTLDQMIDHMDHICQLAGNVNHVAIGTDLDGGFGTEQGPLDVDTIADLQKLTSLLSARGYAEAEITSILSGNWLRKLRQL